MAELVQKTYANSLFEVALENHVQDEIFNDLKMLQSVLMENPSYSKIFSAPIIGHAEKHALLSETFEGSLSFYTLNFLKLLVDNDRFSSLLSIVEEYNRLCDVHNGIMEITAITATTMSQPLKEKLVAKLNSVTQKKVRLNTTVDPSILGGIKLTFNHSEVDASVKTRLEEIKQSIKLTTIE